MTTPHLLAFLHTSPAHVETFARLAAELDPSVPVTYDVDEELLARVLASGMTSDARESIQAAVRSLAERGARVILCTCSTIGGVAEETPGVAVPVLRVDRAMAEQAVASGRRVLVAAALASTFTPTLDLLAEEARLQHRPLDVVPLFCAGAWQHFQRGDVAAYAASIAERIRQVAAPKDAVVLAQASMAPAADVLQGSGLLVLSSPRLGVLAALQQYRTVRAVASNG